MNKPIRVLYVDDNPHDRDMVRDALEKESGNFKVVEAATEKKFKALLEKGGYDLVLSDLNIVDFTGLEVFQAVRAKAPDIPVVIVTGTGSEETAVSAMKLGVADYVIKTLSHIRRLPQTILAVLEKERLKKEHKQAEKEIRQAGEEWMLTFDSITDWVAIHDKDFKIVRTNRAYADNFDMKPDELTGKPCYEVVHGTKEPYPNCPHRQTLETKKPATEEFFEPHLGIYLEITASPIFNENGEATGSVHIAKNITERKQAEDALKESEERLRNFMDSATDQFHLFDSELNWIDVNEAALKLYKLKREEMIGKNFLDLIPDGKQTGRYDAYLKVIKTGIPFYADDIVLHPKFGENIHLSVRAFKVGNHLGVMTTDITERKRTERVLEESEKRHRAVLEAAADPLIVYDTTGKTLYLNPAFTRVFGWTLGELSSKKVPFVPDQNLEETIEAIKTCYSEGYASFDTRRYTKKGNILDISISGSIWRDPQGEPLGMVVNLKDITERKKMEEELRRQNEFLNIVMESLTHPFYVIDANDYTVKMANEAAHMGDLSGKPTCYALTHQRSKTCADPEHHCPLREVKTAKKPVSVEHIHYDKDENARNIEVHCYPIFDSDGTVVQAIEYCLDITERKRAEEELQKKTDELSERVKELNCLYGISKILEKPDISLEEILQGTVDLIPPSLQYPEITCARVILEDREFRTEKFKETIWKQACDIVVNNDRIGALDVCYLEEKPEADEEPFLKEERTLIDAVAKRLGRIIEHRQAEEALRESEERYRDLFENANDLIQSAAPDGRFLQVNEKWRRTFGYSEEELADLSLWEVIHPESLAHCKEVFQKVVSGETVNNIEAVFVTKSGKPVPVEGNANCRFEGGKPVSTRAIFRDITERKEMEEEKKRVEAQLMAAQRMEAMGTLAGGIAHDFNNILSAIIGYAEMMEMFDVPKDDRMRSHLEGVLDGAYRAKNLVNQVLVFSRQAEQERKPVWPSFIVKEVFNLLRPSLPTTIQIRQKIESRDGTVLADPTKIHQILMNLCTNAAHAMREKGGVLEIEQSEVDLDEQAAERYLELEPGPYIRLTVSDTGHGMAPEVMECIFDPYFTTKEKGEGTGLGLAVAHGIVKSYGGAVIVESELGKGSAFQVFLPMLEREAVEHKIETFSQLPTGNECILFVDDEKPLVDLGKLVLEQLGYEVVARTSSVEALEAFRAHPNRFDLVITDMTMPNMTGAELAKEIMKIRHDIPIILCTGFSQMISEDKAKAMGIREFAMKPLGARNLAETARKVLDENR